MRFAEGMFARLCLSMEREMFARVSDKGETCWQNCLTREKEMFAKVSDKGETCSQDCLTRERKMFARVSDEGETCWQDCLTREREMFARVSDKGDTCWQDCLTREREMLYLTTRRDVRQNVEVVERRLAKEVNGKFARLQRKCSRDCTEDILEVADSELTKL